MPWIMRVAGLDRTPAFDFVLPEKDRVFPDYGNKHFERGHRYQGTPFSPLVGRQKDKKKLCDAFHIIGFMCVSLRFKQIVESFEPDVHQFFPISLQTKDGQTYDAKYFIFNPCILIDAYLGMVDRMWSVRWDGRPYIGAAPNATVSSQEIGGSHVWVGDFMGPHTVHISDALYGRFIQEKVRYLWCEPQKFVDVPWRPEEQMPRVMQWLEADPARIRDLLDTRPEWVSRHRPGWLKLTS